MYAAEHQDSLPVADPLWDPQPVQITKQWRDVVIQYFLAEKTNCAAAICSMEYGLQPAHQTIRQAGESDAAVVEA